MPDDGTKPPRKVKFTYKKADNYRQCFVNGAYGAFSPRGDFVCDFFYEFKELPTEQVAEVNEETGQLNYEIIESPELPEFLREVRLGIVLSPQELINIRDWLDKKIEEYNKRMDEESDGSNTKI